MSSLVAVTLALSLQTADPSARPPAPDPDGSAAPAAIAAPAEAHPQANPTAPHTPPLPGSPASVVAARVRAALADASDGRAWSALADALPGMALQGGADIAGTFEAARLADSISAAGAATAARAPTGAPPAGTSWPTPADVGALLAGLVAVAAVVSAGLPRKRTPSSTAAAAARAHELEVVPDRFRTALTLAARGTPRAEIARRTGMAQDALVVLMARQGS